MSECQRDTLAFRPFKRSGSVGSYLHVRCSRRLFRRRKQTATDARLNSPVKQGHVPRPSLFAQSEVDKKDASRLIVLALLTVTTEGGRLLQPLTFILLTFPPKLGRGAGIVVRAAHRRTANSNDTQRRVA